MKVLAEVFWEVWHCSKALKYVGRRNGVNKASAPALLVLKVAPCGQITARVEAPAVNPFDVPHRQVV